MPTFLGAVTRRPAVSLALLTGLVALLGLPAGTVPTDNSLAVWFVEDDPALQQYRAFLDTFGNDEAVVIAFRPEREPGAGAAHMGRDTRVLLERAAAEVAQVEGIQSVLSPVPLLDALDRGLGAAEPALRELGLVSETGAVALIATVAPTPDLDARRRELLDSLSAAVDRTLGAAGHEVHFAGTGVVYEGLNRQTEQDGALFLGLALVVIAVMLRLVLGSAAAVVITLVPPLGATVATTGIIGWTGGSLNVVMATLPALILVIGVADGVHILMEWFRASRAAETAVHGGSALSRGSRRVRRRKLAADVVARMARPCLYTSVTTALGFLALTSSRMAVLRELGVYAAVGVLLVWVLVLVSAAAGLALVDVPPPRHALGRRVAGLLGRLGEWLPSRRTAVVAGFALAVTVLVAGMARISVDTYTLGLLPDDHPVVEDSRWIEANLGHYTPLEFVVEARSGGSVLSPEVLHGIAQWQTAAESLEAVDRTLAATDILALLGPRLPESTAAADSLMRAYTALTGDPLDAYITADQSRARLTTFVPMGTARDFARQVERLEELGAEALGEAATVTATGYLPLYVSIIDYTVSSAITGLALAFTGVFLVLGLLLRSPRATLAAIPPNLFPVAVVFGVMGWAAIPLDIATATVGAVILGIAVDDTVHFLDRHRHSGSAGVALREAGPGIVLTSLVLILGLAVLMAAGSVSIVYFGLLITLAIAAALVADLLLLPVLIDWRGRKA